MGSYMLPRTTERMPLRCVFFSPGKQAINFVPMSFYDPRQTEHPIG